MMERCRIILVAVSLFFFACSGGDKEGEKKRGELAEGQQKDSLFQKDPEKQELVRYPNGNKKMTGRYRNGKRHGVWTSWYKDGSKKSELRFEHGKRHGFYQTWYKNGNLRYKGQYHYGERIGTWKYYDKSGELLKKQEFDHTAKDTTGS